MDSEEFWRDVRVYISRHKNEIIGALLGFLFAILFLNLGFFRTLLIAIFTLGGYLIGSRKDIKEDIIRLIERILPG